MRLLICAGGTGGGVYPALTVLHVLHKIEAELTEVLWVGGEGGMETALVQRAGITFQGIPAAGVHGVGLKNLPGNIVKLAKGFFAARKILRTFQPDVLFFTGGYVAVPMALAGIRSASLLFVPDIEPGLALKVLAWFADRISVPNEDSIKHFPGALHKRIRVSGYPTRPELAVMEKTTAKTLLNLEESSPVILVTGGSKGAQTINRAVTNLLPDLLPRYQIIHISGTGNWEETQQIWEKLPEKLQKNYRVYPYLHEEMSAALKAADLIISRAGASTLGEYPVAGTPAILVPYPYAWRYQKINADYLVSKDAALLLPDEEMSEKLGDFISHLFDHPAKLEVMHQHMTELSQPLAAENIAREIIGLSARIGSTAGGREEVL